MLKTETRHAITITIKYNISSSQYEVLERVASLTGKTIEEYCQEALIHTLESDLDCCFRRCDSVDLLYQKLGRKHG